MYLYPIDMCYHVVVPDAFLVDEAITAFSMNM